jgi:enamine deaminase RidA (YjgF/YER057c/UK114 family)
MPAVVRLIPVPALSTSAEYFYAATAPAGSRFIFLAGACPLDERGAVVAVDDYAAQATRCLENLGLALAAAGASIDNVISTRVLVASSDREDLVTAWNVVRDGFAAHAVPSTLLGVTVLGYPGQLVEIEAVAAVVD